MGETGRKQAELVLYQCVRKCRGGRRSRDAGSGSQPSHVLHSVGCLLRIISFNLRKYSARKAPFRSPIWRVRVGDVNWPNFTWYKVVEPRSSGSLFLCLQNLSSAPEFRSHLCGPPCPWFGSLTRRQRGRSPPPPEELWLCSPSSRLDPSGLTMSCVLYLASRRTPRAALERAVMDPPSRAVTGDTSFCLLGPTGAGTGFGPLRAGPCFVVATASAASALGNQETALGKSRGPRTRVGMQVAVTQKPMSLSALLSPSQETCGFVFSASFPVRPPPPV